MTSTAFVLNLNKYLISRKTHQFCIVPVRHGRTMRYRGYHQVKIQVPVLEARKKQYYDVVMRPLEVLPTIKEKLEEMNKPHPIYGAITDISLPSSQYDRKVSLKDRLKWQKEIRRNKEREKEALAKKLVVDLDEVRKDWQTYGAPSHVKTVAEHYGVFKDLFHHASFTPWIPMNIFYDFDEETVTPVYTGNILESVEADKVPHVHFDSHPNDLWTLVLTNLDGHLLDINSQYLHWFVGNIKGGDVSSGEVICDYLRPFPMRGTGYHRLVFVLYKQEKLIDYSSMRKQAPCLSLKERSFKTFDFYKEHQDDLTPAGLAFYQCIWDSTVTNFFHNVLNMREPVFEYNKPSHKSVPQVHVPHKIPFNIYLDRYRDLKEIKKEVLVKRLKMVHPFKEDDPMPKYPTLHPPDKPVPSWLQDDVALERLRRGKFRDLRSHSVYSQEDDNFKSPFYPQ